MNIREGKPIFLDSDALTKIQSMILIAIIVVAVVIGGAVYVFMSEEPQQTQTIKIGVCTDLGDTNMETTWKGAVLAAEQINAEGGILGKQIELVSEDSDAASMPFDPSKVSLAITKLITYHKVDFVIGGVVTEDNLIIQDIVAEHKIIFIGSNSFGDLLTERVQNNYEKYKYFFKSAPPSETVLSAYTREAFVALREYTGFNKIAYIAEDIMLWDTYIEESIEPLTELHGFEIVYSNKFPPGTVDFTSYFAAAEAAGAEIMIPLIYGAEGISFTKEWCDRQSPMVIWGVNVAATADNYWEITDGKCEHETTSILPFDVGYPFTSQTIPMREAYMERWGETPTQLAASAYDIIRFILPDALERAGTLDTEAVIEALEEVDVETTSMKRFAIHAESHEIMYGPGFGDQFFFQWQDGTRVPVYPREIKEKEGITYTFPDWPGPWDDLTD
jgi:branched-chain amino acid transport system substrate-binding protein